MAVCRSCKRPVIWTMTEAKGDKPGKRMPLDADPDNLSRALRVDKGNLLFTGTTAGDGTPIVRFVTNGPHRSHFATCEQSKEWRRK